MSYNQLQIVNMALGLLGQKSIANIADDNRRAEMANLHWEAVRDECLRLHPWNFAIKRITLAENLLTYSEEFDNAAWTSTNSSETANSTHAPNGELTADTITDADGTNAGNTNQSVTIPDDDQDYCLSVYLKKGTASASAIHLELSGGSTADSVTGIITWGTSPTIDEGTLEEIGDGWYRASITLANNKSGHTSIVTRVYPAGTTGSATGTVFAWGAQLSRNTSAIGYAKTTTAAIRPIIPTYGYGRGFPKPADFVRLVTPEDKRMPYKVEGAHVLTNDESINLEYVYANSDTTTWDSTFIALMVARLAAEMAPGVTGDFGRMGTMMQLYQYRLNEGQFADAKENEQPAERVEGGFEFLNARLGGVSEF